VQKLIHAIYASSEVAGISEHEILKFVKQARSANREHDVSGMMLYIGGSFLQLLEGEPANVDAVGKKTFHDKRAMRLILREPIEEREFPDWTMGFEAVEPLEAERLLGGSRLFASPSNSVRIDTDGAKTLLSIIGRRRWQADRSGMFHAIRRSETDRPQKELPRGGSLDD
jgi:hypothetical protein